MGADIIKVEPPEGEPWRLFAQFIPTESRDFISLNRGKRGLTLDLTKPEAQEIVRKLVPDDGRRDRELPSGRLDEARHRLRDAVGAESTADLLRQHGVRAEGPAVAPARLRHHRRRALTGRDGDRGQDAGRACRC